MDQQGWIQLHRKFMDWEWYTDINTMKLFIHCLLKANHKKGSWRGQEIDRGEFLTSFSHLSKETGLSVQNIRTSIKNLESTGEIKRTSTCKLTKLTVCKYDTYNNSAVNDNKQVTSSQQSANTVLTTNNNDNKENKDIGFEEAWVSFGRFGVKKKSLEYWRRLSQSQKDDIMATIPKYLNHLKENSWKAQKNFEGWINPKNQLWTHTQYQKSHTQSNSANPFENGMN